MSADDLLDCTMRNLARRISAHREQIIENALISGAFANELCLVIPRLGFGVKTTPMPDGGLSISFTDLARLK